MMNFSDFQSLDENEKAKMIAEYLDTYGVEKLSEKWGMSTSEVFDMQLDLVRKDGNQEDDQETRVLSKEGLVLGMMAFDEIENLPPTEKAHVILNYLEKVDGKPSILAKYLGIKVKKVYNLIYTSRKKLGVTEDRVGESGVTYNPAAGESNLLRMSTEIGEHGLDLSLIGEGMSEDVVPLLESMISIVRANKGKLKVNLKITGAEE